MNLLRIPGSGLLLFLLASCHSVGPDYTGAPNVKHQAAYVGAAKVGERTVGDPWWRQLKNPDLNALVDRALEQNFDLQIATERLLQSRFGRQQVAAAFLPQVTAGGGYANVGLSENTGDFGGAAARQGQVSSNIDQWNIGGELQWEIDLFGGGRRQTERARAMEGVAQERLHGLRLATAADVVDAYTLVMGYRKQIATVEENLRLQTKTRDLVRQRTEVGLASQLDLERATAQRETTAAALPRLQAGLTEQLRRLALLLGETSDALDARVESWRGFPDRLPMVRTGLPAALLTRRPDLREAERRLAAATAGIGVARANFYPRFYLLGGAEGVSANTVNLFDGGSLAWQVAPRVEWAIFRSGRNRALLESADSQQREALLAYEKAVLRAIGEVESQLAILQAEQRRHAALSRAVSANREAVALAERRQREGQINLLDLLVEEQRLSVLTLDQVRSRTALVAAWVRLHLALGGGWRE